MPGDRPRITPQAVGAYGEKVVEAELLRHGWLPSNVNASIANAAEFDIAARKGDKHVSIRVKTAGPDMDAFQFGFPRGRAIVPATPLKDDFTVLVRMGSTTRADDLFYVMPTLPLREQIQAHKDYYLGHAKRDGSDHKDLGMWTLHLPPLKKGDSGYAYNYFEKWKQHLNNWACLETAPTSA